MDFRGLFNRLKEQVAGKDGAEAPADQGSAPSPAVASPLPVVPATTAARSSAAATGTGVAGMNSRGGATQGGVVQNDTDDSVYNQRSEHVQRIENMFGEFGSTICAYMLTHSMTDGGVKRIITKLSLSSRGREGADLALIESWILKNGAEAFAKAVNLRLQPAAAPPPPLAPPPAKHDVKVTVRPLEAPRPGGGGFAYAPGAKPRTENFPPTEPRSPDTPTPSSGETNQRGHLQKVTVRPIGLQGKEVVRLHQRPENQTGEQSPAINNAETASENHSAEQFMRMALDEDSKREKPE